MTSFLLRWKRETNQLVKDLISDHLANPWEAQELLRLATIPIGETALGCLCHQVRVELQAVLLVQLGGIRYKVGLQHRRRVLLDEGQAPLNRTLHLVECVQACSKAFHAGQMCMPCVELCPEDRDACLL